VYREFLIKEPDDLGAVLGRWERLALHSRILVHGWSGSSAVFRGHYWLRLCRSVQHARFGAPRRSRHQRLRTAFLLFDSW